jgi:uncharacterized FlaG/YvyC family protein
MEFGLIPNLEQFQFNSQKKIQTVNELNPSKEIKDENKLEDVAEQDVIGEIKELKEKETVERPSVEGYNEFTLTNLNFGYNSQSKDFFVKVIRGEAENQYPTDEMMKLRAYLREANQAS